MGNDLMQHALPGLMSPGEMRTLIDSFSPTMEGGEAVLTRLPSKAEREVLQKRLADLRLTLRPVADAMVDKERAVQAIGLMFAGFTSLLKADAVDLTNAFLMHLQTLPLFALVKACEAVTQNRIPDYDPKFPPTSPQLYSFAAKAAEATRIELLKVERILGAKRVLRAKETPGAKERIEASRRDFHARMQSMDGDGGSLMTPDERVRVSQREVARSKRMMLDDYAKLGLEPVERNGLLISPTLASSLGVLMRKVGER